MIEPDRPHMTIWPMHIACWITKATDTHSDYVLLIALTEKMVTATYLDVTFMSTFLSLVTLKDVVHSVTTVLRWTKLNYEVAFGMANRNKHCAFIRQSSAYIVNLRYTGRC
jgi:hypothetical protein